MKWFILFLGIIVMAGALTPCCPNDNCGELQGTEKGMCSPFFACGSCTGFVQLAKQVSIPVPAVERAVHYERLISSFTSSYYSSFFQPPRVS